jgi:predicted nucleic acid-binding protein
MAAVPHVLDSNTLLRLAKRDDPEHALVTAAIERLIEEGAEICYTPQNVVEFWNVFTRPREKNGFGLSVAEADRQAGLIETRFAFLPDNERIHGEWRRLVVAHAVSGAQVHDARLVAAMRVHGITHLLTLNKTDFLRYRDITAVHPGEFSAAI